MKFVNPLPFVQDMERSKAFYGGLLGLAVVEDHGNFVRFENGFALHRGRDLHQTVFGVPPDGCEPFGRLNLVLYFEDEDIHAAFERLVGSVALIHGIRREPWGQLVFRFYDPDGHIIEIGEPLPGPPSPEPR